MKSPIQNPAKISLSPSYGKNFLVVRQLLFRIQGDIFFLSALCAGLKPVVNTCRSYGTLSKRMRYVAFIYSLRWVKPQFAIGTNRSENSLFTRANEYF